MASVSLLDLAILVLLVGLVLLVALAVKKKSAGGGGDSTTSNSYFLANRSIPWWASACSLFAANIGNEHFVGQAGTAANSGIAVGLIEWLATYQLLLLGFFFGPTYIRAKLSTIPEFFEKRFSSRVRLLVACISLLGAVMTKISATLFTGAILCQVVLGIDFWLSLPFLIFAAGAYTYTGGLKAVIYTEVAQMIIFTLGGILTSAIILTRVGGIQTMFQHFSSNPHTADFPHLIRPLESEFSWLGMFIGQFMSSMWYWCLDQEMAQRIISTPSIKHGKAASIAAGFLKLLPPFMIVLPGMAARFMFDKCIESNSSPFPDWCETRLNVTVETNKAYPYLIIKTLPTGVVGLILASMALSMMSALSGVFNSTSTVLTFDIYKRYINPTVSDASAVRIGRLSTLLLTFISLAWLALIRLQNNAIYLIIQNIQTHVAPPLATVSLLAMIFPWVNEKGALVGILGGTGLGLIQYIAGMMARPQCIAEGNVTSFSCIGYFHFAGIVAVIVGMVTVGVSLWSDEKWRWRRKTVNNVNNDPETPPYDRIITTDNLDGAHQESDNNNNNNNEIADNMSNEPSTSPLHTLNRRSSQYPRSSNDMETGNTATASSAANDCDDTRPLVHYEESMDRSETSIELSVPMWFLHTAALVLALSSASLIIYFR